MRVNRILRWTVALMFVSALVVPQALAYRGGYYGHHRSYGWHHGHGHFWGGLAVGVGAAVLGSLLLQPLYPPPAYTERIYVSPPPPPSGHWETRRFWHPPGYEQELRPGYYDPSGRWVPERWVTVGKRPGYWTEEQVWVP